MDRWGNNPPTVEAIATALTVVAIIFAWLSLRESKEQRKALETEINTRMRPWVGLFDFRLREAEDGPAKLIVLLRNFGPLPAQRARLGMVMEPRESQHDEQPNQITYQEATYKALMPTEEGRYTIDLSPYPQLAEWRGAARDVVVNGMFEYALDEKPLQSQFQATLWFSENHSGDAVRINWRNTSAV
jgi:hypothetical protein